MSEFRLSPAARRDVSAIWDYTVENWGVRQAETYLRELQGAMGRIARDPSRGRDRSAIRSGYRSYLSGSHVIFYRIGAGGIDVMRILHERMDPARHL